MTMNSRASFRRAHVAVAARAMATLLAVAVAVAGAFLPLATGCRAPDHAPLVPRAIPGFDQLLIDDLLQGQDGKRDERISPATLHGWWVATQSRLKTETCL